MKVVFYKFIAFLFVAKHNMVSSFVGDYRLHQYSYSGGMEKYQNGIQWQHAVWSGIRKAEQRRNEL